MEDTRNSQLKKFDLTLDDPLDALSSYLNTDISYRKFNQSQRGILINKRYTFLTDNTPNTGRYNYKSMKQRNLDFNFINKEQLIKQMELKHSMVFQQKVLNRMIEEKQVILQDKFVQDSLFQKGEQSRILFQNHYKKINKINEQNKEEKIKDSPLTQMLIVQEKSRQFPLSLGLIETPRQNYIQNFNNFGYGSVQIEALSHGQNLYDNLEKFLLKSNRIDKKGADLLLKNLNLNLLELNLSNNSIGIHGCKNISFFLQNKQSWLESLNIEQNNLQNNHLQILNEGLKFNKTLKILNLQKNYFTDQNIENNLGFLTKEQLLELYIGWNQIGHKGCNFIFQQIKENKKLKVLDIAWNNLTGNISSLCDFFKSNKNLLHINLAFNKFTYQECLQISEALISNQTIYGIHFQGNYGFIDVFGYLQISNIKNNFQIPIQTINGIQAQSLCKNQYNNEQDNFSEKDNCWICENWQQSYFKWTPGVSNNDFHQEDTRIQVCPEFNAYNNVDLGPINSSGSFFMDIMVPPTQFYYYFLKDELQAIAEDQPVMERERYVMDNLVSTKTKKIKMNKINIAQILTNRTVFDSEYQCQVRVIPRSLKQYDKQTIKTKKVWQFPLSIFVKYQLTGDEIFGKCFEFDLQYNKIKTLIKDPIDLDNCIQYIIKKYKMLFNFYKRYASLQPCGYIWCIQQTCYIKMLNDMNFFCENLTLSDCLIKWTVMTTQKAVGKFSPQRCIVRHQFIEIFIRLIEQKFVTSQKYINYEQALIKLIDDVIEPLMINKNPQDFRIQYFWKEQVDKILSHYQPVLENIYQNFSQSKPFEAKILMLEDFRSLIYKIGYMEASNFGNEDINFAFCQSQYISINELDNKSVFEMNFQEFMEALARICHATDPKYFQFNYKEINDPQFEIYKLSFQLESIIHNMKPYYISKKQINAFNWPEKTIFIKSDGEYHFGFYDDD